MAHIPDQAIAPEIEHPVQSYGQLDDPQVGTQVATGVLHAMQEEGPQLVAQIGQLLRLQSLQRCR